MLRLILENDSFGTELLKNPMPFVRKSEDNDRFKNCIVKIVNDIVIDLNAEVDGLGEEFDYRGKLRDATWVKELSKEVVGNHLKLVKRKRILSFASDWQGTT